jgi:hypothetical protein
VTLKKLLEQSQGWVRPSARCFFVTIDTIAKAIWKQCESNTLLFMRASAVRNSGGMRYEFSGTRESDDTDGEQHKA